MANMVNKTSNRPANLVSLQLDNEFLTIRSNIETIFVRHCLDRFDSLMLEPPLWLWCWWWWLELWLLLLLLWLDALPRFATILLADITIAAAAAVGLAPFFLDCCGCGCGCWCCAGCWMLAKVTLRISLTTRCSRLLEGHPDDSVTGATALTRAVRRTLKWWILSAWRWVTRQVMAQPW